MRRFVELVPWKVAARQFALVLNLLASDSSTAACSRLWLPYVRDTIALPYLANVKQNGLTGLAFDMPANAVEPLDSVLLRPIVYGIAGGVLSLSCSPLPALPVTHYLHAALVMIWTMGLHDSSVTMEILTCAHANSKQTPSSRAPVSGAAPAPVRFPLTSYP